MTDNDDNATIRNSAIFDEQFDISSFKNDLMLSIGAECHRKPEGLKSLVASVKFFDCCDSEQNGDLFIDKIVS